MWWDIHNHVIPGVDDGADSPEEAVAALERFREAGVGGLVATPHLDGSLTLDPERLARRLDEIDGGWTRLLAAAEGRYGGTLERAVELRLDVPQVDLSDPRLRLAGGRAVLVEFPFMRVPPRSDEALRSIADAGWQPVLAHPERYGGLAQPLRLVGEWLEAGAILQVNAGALLGRYGRRAEATATALLAEGRVHCLASDYHSRGSLPLREVRDAITEWGGEEAATLLFETNPTRLVDGERPLSVPAVRRPRSLLRALKALLGRR